MCPTLARFTLMLLLTASSCKPRQPARRVGDARPQPAADAAAPASRAAASAKTKRPELATQVVYSLLDNRLLAHLSLRDGLLVSGDHSLAKYLHRHRLVDRRRPMGNWNLNPGRTTDGVAPAGRSTQLMLPLDANQARARAITLRLRSPSRATFTVYVDRCGARGRIRLRRGWQRVRVSLPKGALHRGDNPLTLDWGSTHPGRRLAWLHVGPHPAPPRARLPHFDSRGLALPANSAASWIVAPPANGLLELKLRRLSRHGGSCALDVVLERSRLPVIRPIGVRRTTTRRLPLGSRGFKRRRLPLGRYAHAPLRITLRGVGRRCQGVLVTRASVVTSAASLHLASQTRRRPKNVLLWVIDTARADHYPLYNTKTRVQTPLLSRLARRGVVFENAYSTGVESQTGYGALWTGAHPAQNGELALAARSALPSRWTTLPEAMLRAGRLTGCFGANGFVAMSSGYANGCQRFHNSIHDGGSTDTKALVDRALRFVNNAKGRPFFLYLGTIDPHVSLHAREPWISRYHPEPYRGAYRNALYGLVAARFKEAVYTRREGTKVFKNPVAPRHRARIIAIYDSTISYNDAQLARLWTALERKGIAKDTLLVVTADHGEELWDDGGFGHGHKLRDYITRVPLLLYHPPTFRPGARVIAAVSGVDLMPTVLGALDVAPPDNVQGADLRALVDGRVATSAPRGAVSTRLATEWALRLGGFKLIATSAGHHLYALRDLVERPSNNQMARRWLLDALNVFLAYQAWWRHRHWGAVGNHRLQLSRDLRRGSAPKSLRKATR